MATQARGTRIARLRRNNQLTIPAGCLAEIGASVGDRFFVRVVDGGIDLRRVETSYAGVLAGVYPADWAEQLRKDRDGWRA